MSSPLNRSIHVDVQATFPSGEAMTKYVKDVALAQGKTAVVATSSGSTKYYVCHDLRCGWWVRGRVKAKPRMKFGPYVANRTGAGVDLPPGTWYIQECYDAHSTYCLAQAAPTLKQVLELEGITSLTSGNVGVRVV